MIIIVRGVSHHVKGLIFNFDKETIQSICGIFTSMNGYFWCFSFFGKDTNLRPMETYGIGWPSQSKGTATGQDITIHELSNEKYPAGCLGYIGDYTTQYIGFFISQYKDPYQPTSIMESSEVFFRSSIRLWFSSFFPGPSWPCGRRTYWDGSRFVCGPWVVFFGSILGKWNISHSHSLIPSMYGIVISTWMVDVYSKCREIYHTWILWVWKLLSWAGYIKSLVMSYCLLPQKKWHTKHWEWQRRGVNIEIVESLRFTLDILTAKNLELIAETSETTKPYLFLAFWQAFSLPEPRFFLKWRNLLVWGTHVDPAEAETLIFAGSRRHA